MRTIWKFVLRITDEQSIDMPEGGCPMSVGEQNGNLVLWAEVDASRPTRAFPIRIVGTGNPFSGEVIHIGTVPMSNGLVWHVYGPLHRVVGEREVL